VQILRVTPSGEIGFVAQEFFQTGPLLSLFFCRPEVSAQASSVVRSSLLRRQGSIGINFFFSVPWKQGLFVSIYQFFTKQI